MEKEKDMSKWIDWNITPKQQIELDSIKSISEALLVTPDDSQLWNKLYLLVTPRIKRWIISYKLGAAIEIDDVVMDVWVKIIDNFKNWDPTRSRFTTWAFTIAKNHANFTQAVQKREPTPLTEEQEFVMEHLYEEELTEDNTKIRANLKLVLEYLKELKYYELAEDAFILGMSMEAIAEKRKMNINTVKSRIRVIRLKVNKKFPKTKIFLDE